MVRYASTNLMPTDFSIYDHINSVDKFTNDFWSIC